MLHTKYQGIVFSDKKNCFMLLFFFQYKSKAYDPLK